MQQCFLCCDNMIDMGCAAHSFVQLFLASILVSIFHAMMVFGVLQYAFPEAGVRLWPPMQLSSLVGMLVGMFPAACCVLLAGILSKRRDVQHFIKDLGAVVKRRITTVHHMSCWLWLVLLLLSMSLFWHFYGRMQWLFQYHQLLLPPSVQTGIMGIGFQLLVAEAALVYVLGMVIMLYSIYYREIKRRSEHDTLTGLYNREAFKERMNNRLVAGKGRGCFVLLDVDDFKQINDTFGHPAGDRVLIYLSTVLRNSFGQEALLGRIGRDEFVAFLSDAFAREHIVKCVEKLKSSLQEFVLLDEPLEVSASIGIAQGHDGMEWDEFYYQADHALYSIKQCSKNSYSFFD